MTSSATPARARFLRLATTCILAAIASLAIVTTASAAPEIDSPYTLYSVDDVCQINLTPETAALTTGATHTVTATVTSTPVPFLIDDSVASPVQVLSGCFYGNIAALEGVDINFNVTSGPNAGKSGVVGLDASGKASFAYVGVADGTDSIAASITLPDICYVVYNETEPLALDACDGFQGVSSVSSQLARECSPRETAVVLIEIECPTITLTDTATATWTSPVVQTAAAPTVSIATSSRCVSRKLTVRPTYSGGTINSSTLFIDSRKVKTKTGSGSFVINTSKYKSGKHHIEIVTVFSNGKSASKFGSFSRCAVRSAAKKVSPQFTG